MSAFSSNHVCDCSTLTNFRDWGAAISAALSTCGWLQSSDTGQYNWTSGTLPTSGTYVYEIWQPNDGLTNFYLKVEYGQGGITTNQPTLRLSIGAATNGAGTLTGSVLGPYNTAPNVYSGQSSVTQYECDFSGDLGRFGCMLWRNGGGNCQQGFFVERSVNASGAYTGSHVTLYTTGWAGGSGAINNLQQSFLFGVGVAPISGNSSRFASPTGGMIVRSSNIFSSGTVAFNGSIPFDTMTPNIGYLDYPLTVCGMGDASDFVEGVTFNVTLYGATRTYLPSKYSAFAIAPGNNATGVVALCMRYD